MKKYFFIITFFIITCCAWSLSPALAHPMLPEPVLQFIQANPNATVDEIDQYFVEYYGLSMDQYFDKNPDPAQFPIVDEGVITLQENILKNYDEDTKSKVRLLYDLKKGQLTYWENVKNFIALGIKHILDGTDHVLFVISLVLVPLPWKRILLMVSTFTLAHSITLFLAGTGILTLPGKIVEPIIAFSIAYVAITSVFLQKYKFFRNFHNKLTIVFLFGLFHGLGFAGLFEEINIPPERYLSSLLFFNVGVEIGQILILSVVLPILYFSAKTSHHTYFIRFLASIISFLALFWVVERIFLT